MDNAGLMLRLGKYGFNGLRHTLEAVCDGDRDVLYATVFQFRKYRRPESRAFGFHEPTCRAHRVGRHNVRREPNEPPSS